MVNRSGPIMLFWLFFQLRPGLCSELPLRPGVGPTDRRVAVDVRTVPWTSLVRVQTELGERCTGFLLAPQAVVTAAHCLFLPRVRRFIPPNSIHVLLGYRAGDYAAHARVVRYAIPPAYDPLDEAATAGVDRAVLLLDHRVAPATHPLAAAPVPDTLPMPVLLAGYGQDRDEIAVADPHCALVGHVADGQGRPLLVHNCEATRGTSGAPLLWRRHDGSWAVIGIQIEAEAGAGGRAVPLMEAPTRSGRDADR